MLTPMAETSLTGVRVPLSSPKLLPFLLIQAVCLEHWLRENFLNRIWPLIALCPAVRSR